MQVNNYYEYKPCTKFLFKNINLEPMRKLKSGAFQNGGLKSSKYKSR